MTVINDYSILILCFNTYYPTKYCRKKFLKYGILCGDIYKAIFKIFFETKLSFNLLSVGVFFVNLLSNRSNCFIFEITKI
jgi:hypothetical protein